MGMQFASKFIGTLAVQPHQPSPSCQMSWLWILSNMVGPIDTETRMMACNVLFQGWLPRFRAVWACLSEAQGRHSRALIKLLI
eukprot:41672-Pelagomonas_calceolata.AAC.5